MTSINGIYPGLEAFLVDGRRVVRCRVEYVSSTGRVCIRRRGRKDSWSQIAIWVSQHSIFRDRVVATKSARP